MKSARSARRSGTLGADAPAQRWVTIAEVAATTGVHRTTVHEAIARPRRGDAPIRWRGADLQVEVWHGRGGASGKHYRIAVTSLPAEVRAALPVATTQEARRPAISAKALASDWREDIAARLADQGPPGSPERARAIQDAARLITFREGKRSGRLVGERTLRGWIAAYEQRGHVAAGYSALVAEIWRGICAPPRLHLPPPGRETPIATARLSPPSRQRR